MSPNLNTLLSQEEAQEEFGWKLVHGDVFRPPRRAMLLSVFLGSGVQILFMSLITLVFACLGFLSPANRGALMTCALVMYVCLGTPAGYVSARVYKMCGGERWKSNVLMTALLCPGLVFVHFFVMNAVLWSAGSSAAIPFGTMVALLALWFGISVPLCFAGAYFGFKKRVSFFCLRFLYLSAAVEKCEMISLGNWFANDMRMLLLLFNTNRSNAYLMEGSVT